MTNVFVAQERNINIVMVRFRSWILSFAFALLSAQLCYAEITLASKFGDLVVSGELEEYDQGLYTIRTDDGVLTLRERDVICRGVDGPVLERFSQRFSILPGHQVDKRAMLSLFKAFAGDQKLRFLLEGSYSNPDFVTLADASGSKLAQVGFTPAADQLLVTAQSPDTPFASSIVQVVSRSTSIRNGLEVSQVKAILSGELSDWAALKGDGQPIRILLPAFTEELATVVRDLNEGQPVPFVQTAEFYLGTDQILTEIEKDPNAIGFILSGNAIDAAIPIKTCLGFTSFSANPTLYPMTTTIGFKTDLDRAPSLMNAFAAYLGSGEADDALRSIGLWPLITTNQDACPN